jgi:hypothetical protein
MWKTIGGFVVSNFAEVFVKELVKEIKQPKKPHVQQVRHAASAANTPKNEPQEPITFTKGQVMVFEWVPTSKQETDDPDVKVQNEPSASG